MLTDLTDTSRVMIRDLAPDEKPREKAAHHGIDSLTDVELLALLLGSGIPGKSVIDMAREILADNDNRLSLLARKSISEIKKKYKGMGTAKATLLVAAINFGMRVNRAFDTPDPRIAGAEDVHRFMHPRLGNLNHEEFWVLHLSRANRIMHAECISRGGVAFTAVDAKIIAKSAIDHLSSQIILVHNHPSGNMTPSEADNKLTRKIAEVMKIVEIPVIDHVIVGPSSTYYSYADHATL